MRTRLIACVIALTALAIQVASVDAANASLQLTVPGDGQANLSTALTLRLPANVAAVDGRIFYDPTALEFVGVAPLGAGTAMSPVDIKGGSAFGAYGLVTKNGATTLRLVVAPLQAGNIQVRVVVDAAATSVGGRLSLGSQALTGVLRIDGGGKNFVAPLPAASAAPARAAGPVKTLVGQHLVLPQDVSTEAGAWQDSRLNGGACNSVNAAADANGDGCIDVVDIQALQSGLGKQAATNSLVKTVAPNAQVTFLSGASSRAATANALSNVVYTKTFTVTSALDTADANPGDGTCADSLGRCTLRAAMTEANWSHGPDFIGFNVPGTAPITITITSVLPFLNDTSGGTTIDAYTQPGSRVNTAQYGSNAIPGVAIIGTGSTPRTNIFHISSSANLIRGFSLSRAYRPIGLSGPNVSGNVIVGNWIGLTGTGGLPSFQATDDIYLDAQSANTVIGTPDLADRNVMGYAEKAILLYGPGTNNNIIQNNDLCLTPTGGAATCSSGIDHDFGPKGTQIGGFAANQKNVFGPTTLNGVEMSHGWDPNHTDTSDKWINMNIHVEGNWIGFRMDGNYSSNYRSGLNNPGTADNGNGVNVYDGCKLNVIDGNYIASAYDGINTMRPNCFNNTIQNNIIGVSPLGQAAPLNWWGSTFASTRPTT